MQATALNYSEETATLGDRIETARETCDMSREDLAERLGVKKSTIKKWENDQSEPRSNRLYMMAGILDCHVMWLLNGEGDAPVVSAELTSDDKILALKVEMADMRKDVERIASRIKAMEAQL